jgi:hypothetical protein
MPNTFICGRSPNHNFTTFDHSDIYGINDSTVYMHLQTVRGQGKLGINGCARIRKKDECAREMASERGETTANSPIFCPSSCPPRWRGKLVVLRAQKTISSAESPMCTPQRLSDDANHGPAIVEGDATFPATSCRNLVPRAPNATRALIPIPLSSKKNLTTAHVVFPPACVHV